MTKVMKKIMKKVIKNKIIKIRINNNVKYLSTKGTVNKDYFGRCFRVYVYQTSTFDLVCPLKMFLLFLII